MIRKSPKTKYLLNQLFNYSTTITFNFVIVNLLFEVSKLLASLKTGNDLQFTLKSTQLIIVIFNPKTDLE